MDCPPDDSLPSPYSSMLMFGCILVYLKYYTPYLMPLMVYPKVLFEVDIHLYIQFLASGPMIQLCC